MRFLSVPVALVTCVVPGCDGHTTFQGFCTLHFIRMGPTHRLILGAPRKQQPETAVEDAIKVCQAEDRRKVNGPVKLPPSARKRPY